MPKYIDRMLRIWVLLFVWHQSYAQIVATNATTYTSLNAKVDAGALPNDMTSLNYLSLFGLQPDLSGGIIGTIAAGGGQIKLQVFAYDSTQANGQGALVYGIYTDFTTTTYGLKIWYLRGPHFWNNVKSTDIKNLSQNANVYKPAKCETSTTFGHSWIGPSTLTTRTSCRYWTSIQPVIIQVTITNATLYKFKIPGIGEIDAKDFFNLQTSLRRYHSFLSYPNYVVVAAHRGYWKDYPENSLAAFKAAIHQQVDMVEVDLKLTKDGRLVLAHDFQLGRLTTIPPQLQQGTFKSDKYGDYVISKMDLCDIRPDLCGNKTDSPVYLLRYPDDSNQGKGIATERLPTFEEFLDTCKSKIIVSLDKIDKDPSMMGKAFDIVLGKGMLYQTIFQGGGARQVSFYADAYGDDNIGNFMFTPAFFDDNLPTANDFKIKIDSFIAAGFRVPNCNLVYRNDNDKFLQKVFNGTQDLVQYLQGRNMRVAQFPQWPENRRGNYNPGYRIYNDIQPDIDRRTDWDWMLSKGADMLITDRLEVLVQLLQAKGLRQ